MTCMEIVDLQFKHMQSGSKDHVVYPSSVITLKSETK